MAKDVYNNGITDGHVAWELMEQMQDEKCANCFNYDVCDIKDTPERMICPKE